MEMTAQNLKDGNTFVYREPGTSPDFRSLSIEFIKLHSGEKFAIWFNGKLMHTSKTFGSAYTKLQYFITKYDMVFEGVESYD